MKQVAKLFKNGSSKAVRIPAQYVSRLKSEEVFIDQDRETGNIILSPKPTTWGGFFATLEGACVPADFLDEKDRNQGVQDRDPLRD